MKDIFKTMLCAYVLLWIVLTLLPASFARTTAEFTEKAQLQEVVCSSTEIRNYAREFRKLENCTVVEGHVAVFLIDFDRGPTFEAISLPKLREITEYLVLYHVPHVRTLSNIFPNLSVIRGQKLFYHYALVIFELLSLEDLGLSSLTLIERGAIYIESNPQLCYVDTIDWSRIMATKQENRIRRNKKVDECINMYPHKIEGCPTKNIALGDGQPAEVPLCWNYDTCQKICSAACLSGACYETGIEGLKCCHEECLGGCSGPANTDCFACKGFKYNGCCMKNCPPEMYEVRGRRCLNETECRLFKDEGVYESPWKVFVKDNERLCVKECPPGYTENAPRGHQCVSCSGPCPKVCNGRIVDNLQAAESLQGCTSIVGSLELQITGGNLADLEKYLGQIQEVQNFVRVVTSNIISLKFLRSLKVIRGVRLYHNMYALFVHRNRDLDDIWDVETHPNLTIAKGKIFFLDNPKLCLDKIYNFLTAIGQRNNTDERDISTTTNGDLATCHVHELAVEINNVGPNFATANWTNFQLNDTRYRIGWVIRYRQVPDSANITLDTAKEVCSEDLWKTVDVKPELMSVSIRSLLPFTKYAVYVQAYMVTGMRHGATSPMVFFRTEMSVPSPVKKLTAKADGISELQLTWVEPEEPNGIITHYIVSWYAIEIDGAKFEKRDYCVDRIRSRYHMKVLETSPADPAQSLLGSDFGSKCCQCPQSNKQLELEQNERQFDIIFENYLHDIAYVKSQNGSYLPKLISKRDVEASKMRAEAVKAGIVSTTALSSSSASMVAALGVPSSTAWIQVDNRVTEETRSLKWRNIMNSTTVIGNNSITLTDLPHFQEYWIEVKACQGPVSGQSDRKQVCSMPATAAASTKPDYSADNIDTKTVTLSHRHNGSYLLQWASPPKPNAVIVAFEIELSRVDVENYKPDVLCITYKAYRESNGTRFSRALSWGNWSYRIRALSLAGNGSWTSVQHFLIKNPEPNTSHLQHLLGTIAVIPLMAVLIALISYFVIRHKRRFEFPEVISYNPEYINPEDLYVADEWEMRRDQVTLLDALGQGSFGMVYRGLFRDSDDVHKEPVEVAVKTVNESSTLRDRIAFLHEASVMKAFDSNHVVKLLGIVSKGQPSLVIMELMSNGDLKSFLRKHRPGELETEGVCPPTLEQILEMAGEIADGMAYLASRRFVHRDLAARNCMVSSSMTVKIGDFGLTRDIYATDYYRKNTKGLLPVRWMAPESLKDGIFSLHSDVWSYGVVLWEMATLAIQPYQGLSNEEVLHYVIDGGKMAFPEKCPEKLVTLMSMCWNSKPEKRPTFEDIIEILLPDLNPKFSDMSYYSTRTGREGSNDMQGEEEEREREEELDENSKTPLTISFAPIRSGSKTTRHCDASPNSFSPRVGRVIKSKPHLTKPAFELFETADDFSGSCSYPELQCNREGQSNNRFGRIGRNVKSAVNLLATAATLPGPGIIHIIDVKRNTPSQIPHRLVSL